ncbi:MAG: tetratricopeptide repeat protein, partial [Candidatus Poribacteria bacterium]|nr:tetratricopeptide repeat protein [Candidatus Poribacteria bacterium]
MNRFHLASLILVVGCMVGLGCGEDSWTKKGKALLAAGDYQDAVAHFQRSLQTSPENTEAHYQLGTAYLKLEQHTEAIESLRKAARHAPERMDVQLA